MVAYKSVAYKKTKCNIIIYIFEAYLSWRKSILTHLKNNLRLWTEPFSFWFWFIANCWITIHQFDNTLVYTLLLAFKKKTVKTNKETICFIITATNKIWRASLGFYLELRSQESEAIIRRCSVEKVFWETSKNSQKNTCARGSLVSGTGVLLWILRNF